MITRPRGSVAAAVAVLLATALGAAACGDGAGSGGKSGKLKMGIAVANYSLNFAREMYEGATEASKQAGNIDFKVVGPPNTDGPAEQQLFQNLTVTHPDGIVLENLDPPIFTRPAAQAVQKGIPIVALDTAPTKGSKVDFYVGNDNYELGGQLAEATVKKLGADAKGTVVVGVPNPGTPVLDSRAKGIKDTFARLAPGIRVLGPFQTYSDPAQNYGAWQSQVNANPAALAFLGVGDADSYNLGRLKEQRKGKYLTAGFDVDPKTLEYIKKGTNFAGVDPEHYLKGYVATALMIKAVREKDGKLPKGWFKTPGLVMDSANIDEIIKRQQSVQNAFQWYKPQLDKLIATPDANIKPLGEAR
ncbi:sugar ABC transporter substrate-binding protein [Actinomadura chibensis]|uniref:Substrate-binding domain-containing protein n=1 Tax=Actinomadura chibensis TaxID=392828 RepID=A0A5D0N6N8_9ACTN|nr:sugar ABC transporter substrate-binding protein [Actinomadura chibensis]TYB40040.1 substrate-binding domain-containing protein [Actinomadura chibensis]